LAPGADGEIAPRLGLQPVGQAAGQVLGAAGDDQRAALAAHHAAALGLVADDQLLAQQGDRDAVGDERPRRQRLQPADQPAGLAAHHVESRLGGRRDRQGENGPAAHRIDPQRHTAGLRVMADAQGHRPPLQIDDGVLLADRPGLARGRPEKAQAGHVTM
jgi:hypothetical protein